MSKRLIGAAGLGFALALGSAGPAFAAEPLKIGLLATLTGTYTVFGEDGVRGFEVARKKFGNMAGGREIEVVIGATDASPDSAIRAARKVVEQDKVDIVIGPLSGSEGIAIKDYAKTQPQVTFINGISGAQETTYVDPAPNFFRFNMDGAQWSSGIAEYIYNENGQLENPGFLDYRVPVCSDVPMIDAVIIEEPNPRHPYGVRGVGETPIVPPMGAITNAVANAIGIRMTSLPMSPPRVLEALDEAAATLPEAAD